jgi:hypothetical protein
MRKIVTALIVVSAFTLSACGAAETAAPPTTKKPATTTTTTTATTTTTTTTIPVTTTTLSPQQTAQAAYFYIVAEINPLQYAIEDQYDIPKDDGDTKALRAFPAYCGETANVQQRYGQLLATTVWPPEYQPQVTDVISKNSVVTQLYFQCAGLPGTFEAQYRVYQEISAAEGLATDAVSALRGVLGLPIDR